VSLTLGGATSDRVQVPAASSINTLSTWTWKGWYYPTAITSGRHLFSKSDSSSPFGGRSARILTGGFIRADVVRATTSSQYITNSLALTANKWWYIAITYDESGAAGEVFNIYVGDLTTLATEATYSTVTNGSGATTSDALGDLRIGNASSQVQAWPGPIGPCAHSNRVESLAEIQAHQFEFRPSAGCVGLWNLGDNGTGTQPDFSGNGNSGTVTGATLSAGAVRRARAEQLHADGR
jgi:Concanavalin A-like lectin/glucanases superfamily